MPGAEPADDWEILGRVAAGEPECFAILVERHQDRLVRVCQRLLHDREDALDAAQEVFLKAFRKAGSLTPEGQLFTWLYRVAVNHCLNRLRRTRLVRFLSLSGQGERQEENPAPDPADAAPDPAAALLQRERWRATREAIRRLPPSQQAVLILARFEGLSHREIARALGITEGAVESRLFRALRRLEAVRARLSGGGAAQESAAAQVSRRRDG